MRGAQLGCVSLWVRGHAGTWVPRWLGKRARGFRCVAMWMPRCVRRCEGSRVCVYRLVDKRVYGVRMSRRMRCVGVQVRGSEVPRYVRGHAGVRVPRCVGKREYRCEGLVGEGIRARVLVRLSSGSDTVVRGVGSLSLGVLRSWIYLQVCDVLMHVSKSESQEGASPHVLVPMSLSGGHSNIWVTECLPVQDP